MRSVRLGVDVGGTFTDVIALRNDGSCYYGKVLSSPPDFAVAIKRSVTELLRDASIDGSEVSEFIHGATVATNAIITRSGAVTGLITTKGFRDVLEVRRLRQPRLYEIALTKPPTLVPRRLRFEVPERINALGQEEEPLDEASVLDAIAQLKDHGVESVAICVINAYVNSAHEERVYELVRQHAPDMYVSVSSKVLPEIKEYERTSTTVINAYVQPIVDRYIQHMEGDLESIGIDAPLSVMQSQGGRIPSSRAREYPASVVESGPAAGVVAAQRLAARMGLPDALTLDMGGTTAKASLIEKGEISRSPEYEVGGEVSLGGFRLLKGTGYLLRMPSIDLAEVGAGGGSIAWLDEAGALKVGPSSAGANPGPACYGNGGTQPTATDANVFLGLTNPNYLAGGTLKLDPELAQKAITEGISTRSGLDMTDAAWGIRRISNSNLVRAISAVSIERGRNPSLFPLFAFGGMGPVHAADLASELRISTVIIPPLPGLFSALGLIFADVEYHLIRTLYASARAPKPEDWNRVVVALADEARGLLSKDGYSKADMAMDFLADAHYGGQEHTISIPLHLNSSHGPEPVDVTGVTKLGEDFELEHERTYGYRTHGEEVAVSAVRCVARGLSRTDRVPEQLTLKQSSEIPAAQTRKAYFGPEAGWLSTDVTGRHDLQGTRAHGPLLVEEDNSTTVIPPGWTAHLDEWSNIILNHGG